MLLVRAQDVSRNGQHHKPNPKHPISLDVIVFLGDCVKLFFSMYTNIRNRPTKNVIVVNCRTKIRLVEVF